MQYISSQLSPNASSCAGALAQLHALRSPTVDGCANAPPGNANFPVNTISNAMPLLFEQLQPSLLDYLLLSVGARGVTATPSQQPQLSQSQLFTLCTIQALAPHPRAITSRNNITLTNTDSQVSSTRVLNAPRMVLNPLERVRV